MRAHHTGYVWGLAVVAAALFACSSPPRAADPPPDEPPPDARPADPPAQEMPPTLAWDALSGAEAEHVKALLAPNEKIVHTIYRGPMGPDRAGTLALIEVEGGPSRLAGFLQVAGEVEGQRVDLPELEPTQLDEVVGALPVHADDDPEQEILVVSTHMTGMGPEGAVPYPVTTVIDWNGAAARRLTQVEAAAGDTRDPAEAKARIEAHLRRLREREGR